MQHETLRGAPFTGNALSASVLSRSIQACMQGGGVGVKDCRKRRDLLGSVNVRGFSTRKIPGAVSLLAGA